MSSLGAALGESYAMSPLRTAFLKWQCRVRQISMRDNHGRPDDAITPALILKGETEPMGHVITILNKSPGYSVTPEMLHMAAKTNDPAQRREQAIRFLSASYYQKGKRVLRYPDGDVPARLTGCGDGAGSRRRSAGILAPYAQTFDLDVQSLEACTSQPAFPGDDGT